jgi:hypothetical protein
LIYNTKCNVQKREYIEKTVDGVEAMDNQKISLDIRTILTQLNIDYERFTEWEKNNQEAGLWETEWLESQEESAQQIAATQS